MRRFKFIRNPQPDTIGNNVEAFLRGLDGPACFMLEGRDTSRTRALVTLLHGMIRTDAKRGLATLCIGGGQGVSIAVER